MITPLVEKAILNGYGTLHHYSVTGGLAKIPIPKNHFGIITDFDYFPFVTEMLAGSSLDLAGSLSGTMVQEMDFYIRNKSHKFTFKCNFSIINYGIAAEGSMIITPSSQHHVDTMIFADDDVYIQFKLPLLLQGGGFTDWGLLQNTQAPTTDTVGGSYNTIRKIVNGSGNNIIPAGFPDAFTTTVPTDTSFVFDASQSFYPNIAPVYNTQLPICNIQILIVPEQNRNNL